MRRLDQLLIRPIGVGQIRVDRRRRVTGTGARHTFEDDGSASVRVVREGRRPRGGLILPAIGCRVLVGLKEFLIGPIVVNAAFGSESCLASGEEGGRRRLAAEATDGHIGLLDHLDGSAAVVFLGPCTA